MLIKADYQICLSTSDVGPTSDGVSDVCGGGGGRACVCACVCSIM